jgi:serine/threonine protein kinase
VADDPVIGAELGNYRIERALGHGGMGVVYLAEDLALGRHTALKVLAPHLVDDPDARRRFQREIERSTRIEHPHIVPVYQAGYDAGRFYIAMRFVDGLDLMGLRQRDGRFDEPRALRLTGQVASALHAVHAEGYAHRDVKPQNVLVWNGGEADEHAFLTDFGIAKALDETSGMTGMGILGTPAYMAPEIWRSQPATPASDQYALACLLHELLAGQPPFGDNDDLRGAHTNQTPPQLRDLRRDVSAAADGAVRRALAKHPEERFPDVRAFAAAAGRPSHEAIRDSDIVAGLLTGAPASSSAVEDMISQAGYSESRAGAVVGLSRAEVVGLRRRETRRQLMGE